MSVTIISPEAQIEFELDSIRQSLRAIETGKTLLGDSDPAEVERGRFMIGLNHTLTTRHAYCIGQIKWRLGMGDPSDDLEASVRHYSGLLEARTTYGLSDLHSGGNGLTYWSHLVAFVCVILNGSVPTWVTNTLPDQSTYATRKRRLAPWEINLGYQYALARAIDDGDFPALWPRLLGDSADRSGLKRIRQNLVTYENLLRAAWQRDWDALVLAVDEVDANYRKRGSSESSYPEVFGDGPFNGRSIDYIAAAILRSVQDAPGFPGDRLTTPHRWRWGSRDLSHLAPAS